MIATFVLALALAGGADDASKIKVTGKPVDKEATKDAEPVVMIGKKGAPAALAGKHDEVCAGGTLKVRFHPPGTYEFPTKVLALDDMLAELEQHADDFACLLFEGDRPPRADIEAMSKRLVEGHGISLFVPAAESAARDKAD